MSGPGVEASRHSPLADLSLDEVSRRLMKKEISPVELVDEVLDRVEQLNSKLNAFITVTAEKARQQARKAEKEILRKRSLSPLHGIPLSLKDNIRVHGLRTTAGSKFFSDSGDDATVARRLARAGAILIGKTNLHEFAYGVTSENPHFGPVRNPWVTERIPGGSSGGSAAAVASGMGFASLGTDTGGSIRIPAALCGVVGLKPTYGRVSLYGVVPLSLSLDHVGPLTRTVADAAILLSVIAGRDARDSATANQPVPDYPRGLSGKVHGIKLGWPRDFFFERVGEEVRRAVESAAKVFEDLGMNIAQLSLPHLSASVEPSTIIALAEARHYHESAGFFPSRASEYGEDVRKRLEQGGEVSAVDYLKALDAREQFTREFDLLFAGVDAILAPSVPIVAPGLGVKIVNIDGEEEPVRAALLRLNRPANFTGHPAISIPCGFSKEGLPIGIQVVARQWRDDVAIAAAAGIETKLGGFRPPPLAP